MLEAWQADDIADSAVDLEDNIPLKSILDRLVDEPLLIQNSELEGGFKIYENAFDEEKTDET